MPQLKRVSRRRTQQMAAVLAWLLWSAVSSWGQGASGDAQTIIHVDASSKSERPAPILGLEAYREVIETGNYIVGPGDKFLVYVSGVENPFTSQVLAEGGLFIPQVGTINIGGMRLRDAQQKIKERFRLVLKVGEIDFELSQPRHFPVSITGMVAQPGVKITTGVERVSEVLSRAGGLNTMASTRNIRILKTARLVPAMRSTLETAIAAGKMGSIDELPFEIVDLERYKITGDSRYNPYVEDGDIIMVPPQAGKIGAMGALQRPDFFEFVPGDRLSDLLLLALGPAVDADTDNVILFRYEGDMTTRVSHEVDLEGVLAGDPEADMLLKSEDWLNVRAIPEYHSDSQVFISGEVKYPGYYVLEEGGMTLRQLIEQAGDFTQNASLAETRVVRQQFVGDDGEVDPEVERLRFVPVADRTELDNQYFIMKSRERPGQMSVDLVELFANGNEAHNIELLPGDVVVVPTLQQTITVSGAVAQPGAVVYDPAYTVWDYIERSGGYAWRASKDVLVIKALSGEKKRAKDVTRLQAGDRIWIREKPVRDYWTIFTQSMGVIGQVATVVLLFVSITK